MNEHQIRSEKKNSEQFLNIPMQSSCSLLLPDTENFRKPFDYMNQKIR